MQGELDQLFAVWSGTFFVCAEAGCCSLTLITGSATHDEKGSSLVPQWTEVGVPCLVQELGKLTQLTALVLEGPHTNKARQPDPGDADVRALAQLTRLQSLVSRLPVLGTHSLWFHSEMHAMPSQNR